ncbi:nuclear transport factor 2 family protein [Alteromonas sediminis]|uniref:Nuclear transport factor 2 family protein n=1 Tax=Alteromonas sediminis TaxID=2259342 RepID=A0A3N5Y642_9ALTE|nr:nuclear transport factor 2 family protein [Alteromonas sediminis]RPJ65819.1 nuclear transport factor 2 family protein [Alteromonas sediminis]
MKKNGLMVYLLLLVCQLTLASENAHLGENTEWDDEQSAIIEVSRWVALAPKEAGFQAYSDLFHPDFTNWYMAGDEKSVRGRDEYLSLVKDWLEAGNHATYSEVTPVSVDVIGDIAYIRQIKEEHFHHPDGPPTMFIGHFASLMKKYKGKWTFYRTSFETRYRGPRASYEPSE